MSSDNIPKDANQKRTSKDSVRIKTFCRQSLDRKVQLHLLKKEYVKNLNAVDYIEGVVVFENKTLKHKIVEAHLAVTLRYGLEDSEVMGVSFATETYFTTEQIYPKQIQLEKTEHSETLQKVAKKLGDNAYSFSLKLPDIAPHSLTFIPGIHDHGQTCGVYYSIRLTETDSITSSSSNKEYQKHILALPIKMTRKVEKPEEAPPSTIIRENFFLSPGHLEFKATLDRHVYFHGDPVTVTIDVKNFSSKTVKGIKIYGTQNSNVSVLPCGRCRRIITTMESKAGCPVRSGGTLHKVIQLFPTIVNPELRDVATEARVKDEPVRLASSILIPEGDKKHYFGIIISYTVKVKLILGGSLGGFGGDLVTELPFVLLSDETQKETEEDAIAKKNQVILVESTNPVKKSRSSIAIWMKKSLKKMRNTFMK